ncbi:MAG: Rne/Rng family ribonuclease [Saprospiraceae bacterium]|nr:Rne/Rng family ribonuclease [Bacteroidia bacterium]NNF21707.1 Rne/Rng family ribonuclease [Saprospiraceae bacterium]NNK89258.1 Rne/Rng family ribonuclease [Saprospiraceae bacterium]
MEKELLVKSTPTNVEIALLEDRKLVELHTQKSNVQFSVGDIFLGYIKMLRPSLNAAFLDVGTRKDAFLHYTDLGPQINSVQKYTRHTLSKQRNGHLLDDFVLEPDNQKNGKIERVFKKNQPVLVQILKEPISTKGPRLTCEITLAGRFMVITPFRNNVSVSKKIVDPEERKRLKVLIESIKPRNFGFIIRTAAEGKKVADLHDEITNLTNKWKTINSELLNSKKPGRILSEVDKTQGLLRDLLNDSFNKITINDKDLFESTRNYLKNVAPEQAKIVNQYKGKRSIFDHFGVKKQIKSSFSKTPTMASGAYLVIEHTEAMHVVDVNSGPKTQNRDQESAALQVNVEAANEVARQLRLRDLGGLIIIDFIDMRNKENKNILYQKMKESMKGDRAQHTILPLSKFGLMQITRQRVKPELKINTQEVCAACNGTGKMESVELLPDEIERNLKFIIEQDPKMDISLHIHPFVFTHYKKGFINHQKKWFIKYKKWIKLVSEDDFHVNQYKFFNKFNDEIRLTESR